MIVIQSKIMYKLEDLIKKEEELSMRFNEKVIVINPDLDVKTIKVVNKN